MYLISCATQHNGQSRSLCLLYCTTAVHCEKVHSFAQKRFLGVEMPVLNNLVYVETNQFSLFVNSVVKCIHTLVVKINENGVVQITKQIKLIGCHMY